MVHARRNQVRERPVQWPVLPEGGPGPSEYPELVELCRQAEPVVSCYLNTEAETEDAWRRTGIRWKDASRDLEGAGADAATLAAVGQAVEDLRRLGPSVCVLGAGGRALLAEVGPWPLPRDLVHVGPLPVLGPLLGWRQHQVAYITVACDHAGADVAVVGPGASFAASVGDQDRHDPELHKVPGGGWSHRRFQQRVENAWDRNAREVLDLVDRLATRLQPRLVLYGGEPRACGLVEEHAAPALRPYLQRAALSRAADGSWGHDLLSVRRAVERAVEADTAAVIARLGDARPRGLGVSGAADVLGALGAARVEVLVVDDGAAGMRRAYLCRGPLGAALERDELASLDGPLVEDHLADVAVAAALLGGASVRVAPGAGLPDGLGALLRFA
jgi:hypothetical protein